MGTHSITFCTGISYSKLIKVKQEHFLLLIFLESGPLISLEPYYAKLSEESVEFMLCWIYDTRMNLLVVNTVELLYLLEMNCIYISNLILNW